MADLQDAVHEQQRNAAQILRGASPGSGPEAGPGSAPGNTGPCVSPAAHAVCFDTVLSHVGLMLLNNKTWAKTDVHLHALCCVAETADSMSQFSP